MTQLILNLTSLYFSGVSSLQAEIEARGRLQYGNALRHPGLRPYVGHKEELSLVGSFNLATIIESAASAAATLPPDSLHRDIVLLRGESYQRRLSSTLYS